MIQKLKQEIIDLTISGKSIEEIAPLIEFLETKISYNECCLFIGELWYYRRVLSELTSKKIYLN